MPTVQMLMNQAAGMFTGMQPAAADLQPSSCIGWAQGCCC